MEVCEYQLGLVKEGGFEPGGLLKSRSAGTNVLNTPSGQSPSTAVSAIDMTLRTTQSIAQASHSASSGNTDVDGKPMTASEPRAYDVIIIKDAYEYFVTALLSSLSSAFCSSTGSISLNSRTLLLPTRIPCIDESQARQSTWAILATFRIYLTTTGTLLVSLSHRLVHGLVSSVEKAHSDLLSPGTPVLAAPLGVFSTFHGLLDAGLTPVEPGSAQTPDTQISRVRPEIDERLSSWRSSLTKLLEGRGIPSSILQRSPWLNLQYQRRRHEEQRADSHATSIAANVLWPSALCFWKLAANTSRQEQLTAHSNHHPINDFDPLSSARAWMENGDEREEILSKRVKERDSAETRDSLEGDGRNTVPNAFSPLNLQRPGQNGVVAGPAAGAMYPTPPDGIQNPVGATPSFDGPVSSPGNQGSITAVAETDGIATASGHNSDTFIDTWEGGGDIKREPDNIFEDMGADIFAENDITDADFSFFDEQPGGAELDFAAVDDIDDVIANSNNANHTAKDSQAELQRPESKSPALPVSPVFAKPELKHARSSLLDDTRSQGHDKKASSRSVSGIKRQASPFNEETVYKRVRASLGSPGSNVSSVTNQTQRRNSIFEKVNFNPLLSLNNKKYEANGRFGCDWTRQTESDILDVAQGQPLHFFSRRGRARTGPKHIPSSMGALIASITGGLESSSLERVGTRDDESVSDADDNSIISGDDELSEIVDPSSPQAKSTISRRRLEDDTASLPNSIKEQDITTVASPSAPADLCRFPTTDSNGASIAKYFAEPQPVVGRLFLNDEVFMVVAQILTEQAVSGNLELPRREEVCLLGGDPYRIRRELAEKTRCTVDTLRSVLPASLGNATLAQLKPLIEVQDVPLLGQPNRLQPRPPAGTEQLRPNLFQIPAPHFELRRYDNKLSVTSSAATFWEVLGLGASPGSKDVLCACVYPHHNGLSDDVQAFLDRTRIQYEALKLGTHDRISTTNGISDGLIPIGLDNPISTPSNQSFLRPRASASDQMGRLAQALAAQSVSEKNFVIYFVYAPENAASIMEACIAFHKLYELYKKALSARSPIQNELVLQLIPLDFLSSTSTLVLPDSPHFVKLCVEVYDRCTLFNGPMPSPAIVLEQPLPRMIEFKLTNTPSTNLFHENSCLHIAYARSIDERWVTAAWTDNRGANQMASSYCLGRKGGPLTTPITDVIHEIWETTHDFMSMWKVHWRVIVTKCGPIEPEEIDFWINLGKAESRASVNLTLLGVDTNPSLQLLPPPIKVPTSASSMFYSTPVSTPQTNILSPDQSGNPPTPIGATSGSSALTPGAENSATEPESDTTLVDITDSTWGTVASHRLNNSPTLQDLNPSLASGYLIKRGGARPEDPPVLMEVNVIHSEGSPRVYELLLREMLTYFRGLGTLARARGMVDRETDVRPWHVAAAEKGVQALYQLM
jgi:mediator of RNA polymerase II transcription subunit 13, fungi type